MIEKREAIALRSKAISTAKDVCEVCGKGALLLVRTKPEFDFRKYFITGKLEQRELCAVCQSCSERMVARSRQDHTGSITYCSITASGQIIEYR